MHQAENSRAPSIVVGLQGNAVAGFLGALTLFILALYNLGGPGMWWDEGWTLSVARNTVELGHYGRLLDGRLAPPGLEAAFPVTAPIALSFELFGVGIWQGRLFGVLCTVAALALMYYLALRLYNRAVAIGTLFVLLLMSMHPQLHPLIMGRQVLAELPMMAYLLAGYAAFFAALRRPAWLPVAIAVWGVALISKAQTLPFWAFSLLVPLTVALLWRQWRIAGLITAALLGGLALFRLLPWLLALLLRDHSLPTVPVQGLYEVLAFVPSGFNRVFALQNALIFGLPTLGGLGYAAWQMFKTRNVTAGNDRRAIIRLALLVLSGSWFAWYLLLSVGVPRYLFPATFIGSIFAAAWLAELTSGFDFAATLNRSGGLFRKGKRRQASGALLAIMLMAATLPITIQTLYYNYLAASDRSAQEVADFFNTQTAPGTRIETYESELHFLLDRPYHYPPDQVHVELNRRGLLHQDVAIQYDALADDPAYLVVGRFARGNGLYDPVIAAGAFRLLRTVGLYDVYERVR